MVWCSLTFYSLTFRKNDFLVFQYHEYGQQLFPQLTFAPREGLLNDTPNEAFLTINTSGAFTIDVFYDGQPLSEGITILVLTRKFLKNVENN